MQKYEDSWFGTPSEKAKDDHVAAATIQHPLSFNYDAVQHKAINPNFTLLSDNIGIGNLYTNIQCTNCFLTGSLSLGLRFKGASPLQGKLPQLSLALDGNIFYNADFHVRLTGKDSRPLVEKTLISVPIGGIDVPGLLQIGPLFKVVAGVSYTLQEPVAFQFGYGNLSACTRATTNQLAKRVGCEQTHLLKEVYTIITNIAITNQQHHYSPPLSIYLCCRHEYAIKLQTRI